MGIASRRRAVVDLSEWTVGGRRIGAVTAWFLQPVKSPPRIRSSAWRVWPSSGGSGGRVCSMLRASPQDDGVGVPDCQMLSARRRQSSVRANSRRRSGFIVTQTILDTGNVATMFGPVSNTHHAGHGRPPKEVLTRVAPRSHLNPHVPKWRCLRGKGGGDPRGHQFDTTLDAADGPIRSSSRRRHTRTAAPVSVGPFDATWRSQYCRSPARPTHP